jgi:hypothetical protein
MYHKRLNWRRQQAESGDCGEHSPGCSLASTTVSQIGDASEAVGNRDIVARLVQVHEQLIVRSVVADVGTYRSGRIGSATGRKV